MQLSPCWTIQAALAIRGGPPADHHGRRPERAATAGGATTAAALATAGRSVLVLEEGPWVDPDALEPFSLDEMVAATAEGMPAVTAIIAASPGSRQPRRLII